MTYALNKYIFANSFVNITENSEHMETAKNYLIPSSEFLHEIKAAVAEEIKKQFQTQKQQTGEQLFYIAQVAKKLNRSHATIKKLVASGVIRSTKNGMISESAIEEFLKGN